MMRPAVMPARVLVLGECRPAVAAVRALARAGFEVTLGSHRRSSATAWSRFVSDVWLYDDASPARFCNHVEAFLRSERPDYVLPLREPLLHHLLHAGPRLERLAAWVHPGFATLARCLERGAMHGLAASLGMAIAERPGGARRGCRFAAAEGRLLCYGEEARSGPVLAPSGELRARCQALAAALGYTGAARVEFAAGADDEVAFAGLDPLPDERFVLIAVQLAAYRAARAAGRDIALPPLAAPAAEPGWLGFDWRDPLPELHRLWTLVLEPLGRRLPRRLGA